MANIASDSISVFPTVNRGDRDQLGRSQRLFTEQNVRDIANMVNSKDSYVICVRDCQRTTQSDTGTPTQQTAKCIEFCLGGYHVLVDIAELPTGTVYALAQFDSSTGNLKGDNTSKQYTGISFVSDKPADGTYLLLGTKDGNIFTIAKKSEIMYDGARVDAASLDAASIQSINLTLIDGGTI